MRRSFCLVFSLAVLACSHDWDSLEPAGGGAASQGGGGAASSSSQTSTGAGPTSGSTSVSGSTSSGMGGGSETVEYYPTVAECINPANPDPAACESATNGGLDVDLIESMTDPHYSFLRFDLDGVLSGRTIDSVTLRLVASGEMSASSDMTGEVWEVTPFTEADLSVAAPAQVGGAPIAPSGGSLSPSETVDWSLPLDSVAPSSPVFLGLYPLSSDGAHYTKAVPNQPRIIVVYH